MSAAYFPRNSQKLRTAYAAAQFNYFDTLAIESKQVDNGKLVKLQHLQQNFFSKKVELHGKMFSLKQSDSCSRFVKHAGSMKKASKFYSTSLFQHIHCHANIRTEFD